MYFDRGPHQTASAPPSFDILELYSLQQLFDLIQLAQRLRERLREDSDHGAADESD